MTLDIAEPAHETELCDHCGQYRRGHGSVNDANVCHTGGPFPDCYRLVTVYEEPIGARKVAPIRHRDVLEKLQELVEHMEIWREGNRIRRPDGLGYADSVTDETIKKHAAQNLRGGKLPDAAFAQKVLTFRRQERKDQ